MFINQKYIKLSIFRCSIEACRLIINCSVIIVLQTLNNLKYLFVKHCIISTYFRFFMEFYRKMKNLYKSKSVNSGTICTDPDGYRENVLWVPEMFCTCVKQYPVNFRQIRHLPSYYIDRPKQLLQFVSRINQVHATVYRDFQCQSV